MKVEFLPVGSCDCPLIRIFGRAPEDFSALRAEVLRLAAGACEFVLTELPNFDPVEGCRVTAVIGTGGVRATSGSRDFVWANDAEAWLWIADLIEPFELAGRSKAHQWLCGDEAAFGLEGAGIAVVLSNSADGSW